jgi:hypothetical protein
MFVFIHFFLKKAISLSSIVIGNKDSYEMDTMVLRKLFSPHHHPEDRSIGSQHNKLRDVAKRRMNVKKSSYSLHLRIKF